MSLDKLQSLRSCTDLSYNKTQLFQIKNEERCIIDTFCCMCNLHVCHLVSCSIQRIEHPKFITLLPWPRLQVSQVHCTCTVHVSLYVHLYMYLYLCTCMCANVQYVHCICVCVYVPAPRTFVCACTNFSCLLPSEYAIFFITIF